MKGGFITWDPTGVNAMEVFGVIKSQEAMYPAVSNGRPNIASQQCLRAARFQGRGPVGYTEHIIVTCNCVLVGSAQ